MGAVVFISLGLMVLSILPFLTSYYAKQKGRNPKLWFAIGVLLPGIATLILNFFPDKTEKSA